MVQGEAMTEEFQRYCVVCSCRVPLERLKRGADTCSVECKQKDRLGMRALQRQLNQKRLLGSPWFRKLVREAGRSARGGIGEEVPVVIHDFPGRTVP